MKRISKILQAGKFWHAYMGQGIIVTVASSNKGWSATVAETGKAAQVLDFYTLGAAIDEARNRTERDYNADA